MGRVYVGSKWVSGQRASDIAAGRTAPTPTARELSIAQRSPSTQIIKVKDKSTTTTQEDKKKKQPVSKSSYATETAARVLQDIGYKGDVKVSHGKYKVYQELPEDQYKRYERTQNKASFFQAERRPEPISETIVTKDKTPSRLTPESEVSFRENFSSNIAGMRQQAQTDGNKIVGRPDFMARSMEESHLTTRVVKPLLNKYSDFMGGFVGDTKEEKQMASTGFKVGAKLITSPALQPEWKLEYLRKNPSDSPTSDFLSGMGGQVMYDIRYKPAKTMATFGLGYVTGAGSLFLKTPIKKAAGIVGMSLVTGVWGGSKVAEAYFKMTPVEKGMVAGGATMELGTFSTGFSVGRGSGLSGGISRGTSGGTAAKIDPISKPTTKNPFKPEFTRDVYGEKLPSGKYRYSARDIRTDTRIELTKLQFGKSKVYTEQTKLNLKIRGRKAQSDVTLRRSEIMKPKPRDITEMPKSLIPSRGRGITTRPKTDITTTPKFNILTRPKTDLVTRPKTDLVTRGKTDVTTLRPRPRPVKPTGGGGGGFGGFPIIKLPNFGGGGGGLLKSFSSGFKPRAGKRGYKASLSSREFNIVGKTPRGKLSGLEERPLKRKRKKGLFDFSIKI